MPGTMTAADQIAAEQQSELYERWLAHQEPLARHMDEIRRLPRPSDLEIYLEHCV